jgi:hypothetical protein
VCKSRVAENLNGRRKPSGDHLPGWVGCCRSVVRSACVSLDDPAIQRFRQNPLLNDEYHAPRKGVNCIWVADGIFCKNFGVVLGRDSYAMEVTRSCALDFDGLEIESVANAAGKVPGVVGLL